MGDLLVTGAAGGIGSAVVSALEAAGHRVTALGRSLERLPGSARRIEADLSRPETLAAALGALGELDALIHCAGTAHVAPVADAPVELWNRTLAVNLASAAEITRLALPALRRSRGHVVFVNASPGMRAVPRWSAFVGSKTALRELADSLREEEEPHGVRVTTVYPAATATDHLRDIRASFGRPYDPAACIQPDSLAAMIVWLLAAPADSYACELAVIPAPPR
ncbi:SDR family NAD(P)-dependent oxidoreductase [Nonomuraea sediminis]|uniref:SDR family NAD(P)-dependent oxidoreductase n=1 Tax=Nonomuraea sediminis TaxID=2835864 RepID=UPI001BDD8BBE|nr:SDR family NAD(P)-dependent oxidoreductase [Nonomuraea sediminis]